MTRIVSVIVLFVLSLAMVKSQTIIGEIIGSGKAKIVNATVLFFESADTLQMKEYTIARNGSFTFKPSYLYKSGLAIRVEAYGYHSKWLKVKNYASKKIYEIEVVLSELEGEVELDEVAVIARKKPYKVKEDTVAYNVQQYSDGSEKKVEDLIKNLPGIEVNERSGEIKYKGTSIETVTLDGDNLFDSNYTLGTRNININLVEQIEAIDNYSENSLLKGIDSGGKVSLNLKLKKGKTDFSGGVEYGSGWFAGGSQAFDLDANLLGINKRSKSFAVLTYNNIGSNKTPFDYLGFNVSTEQLKERNEYSVKIIPETRLTNRLNLSRVNVNNQFFANYNAIFNLNSKVNLKTNLYYLQDRISSNQLFENSYLINNNRFSTSDNIALIKKPQQLRGDFEIKYNTSKTSLLEYNIRLRQENIATPTRTIQNENNELTSLLDTDDFYLKQDVLWTQKVSDRKAFQFSLLQSYNNLR